jgi:hypothetical protein
MLLANSRRHLNVPDAGLALRRTLSMTREIVSHQDSVVIEEDTGPAQAEDLAATHPSKEAHC